MCGLLQIFLWGTEGGTGRAGESTEETSRQEVSEALGFVLIFYIEEGKQKFALIQVDHYGNSYPHM